MTLSINEIVDTNISRAGRWHPGFPQKDPKWTGADWSNAMQGEAGEAGNVVKKLRRLECGLLGRDGESEESLIKKLAFEIADTILYACLLSAYYNIDLEKAIIDKFNLVSEELGFPERL